MTCGETKISSQKKVKAKLFYTCFRQRLADFSVQRENSGVKFLLINEERSPGDSSSDSSERLLKEEEGKVTGM